MSVHTLPPQDKISAELEWLQMLHNKTTSNGGDDHVSIPQNSPKGPPSQVRVGASRDSSSPVRAE